MERLRKVVGARCWAFGLMCSATVAAGQSYCSLTVRVVTPTGARPAIAVSVEEKSGRIEEKDPVSGDVQFCDLGGLPVTVKVGYEGACNQVIVKEVPVSWREPYLLHILYDPTSCYRDLPRPPVPVCRVVFRVSGTTGKWINAAEIHVSRPLVADIKTDQFGRASFVAKLGDEVKGFALSGDQRSEFTFTCTLDEPVHEEQIKLRGR